LKAFSSAGRSWFSHRVDVVVSGRITPILPLTVAAPPPAADPEAAELAAALPDAAAEVVVPDELELDPQAASSSAPAATIPTIAVDFRRMNVPLQ